MATPSAPAPQPPIPGDLPLQIIVTSAGQARVGERTIAVPAQTDPRVAAAEFVSGLARRHGRDISAVLVDGGLGETRRMIFKADGQILQSKRPMHGAGGAEKSTPRTDEPPTRIAEAAARTHESIARASEAAASTDDGPARLHGAVVRTEHATDQALPAVARTGCALDRVADAVAYEGSAMGQALDLADPASEYPEGRRFAVHGPGGDQDETPGDLDLMMTPGPPLDVDPDSVPVWPHFDITLLNEMHVVVNGVRHVIPHAAEDPRAFGVAMAAAQLRRIGLARPVRATARDPDGTAWPILIHPSGAATEAGPAETSGEKGRRGRRTDRDAPR